MPVAPMTIAPGAKNNFGAVLSNGQTHKGLDIAPPARAASDTVVAPEKSEVVDLFTNDLSPPFVGYGPGGILLRGDSGVFHLLAHLDPAVIVEQGVKKGQRFDEGEQVGLISRKGPKGDGTPTPFWQAPHLHWEVRKTAFAGPAINPVAWLAGKEETFGVHWVVWLLVGWALSRAR